MVLDARGKLISHLRGHESVRNMLLFKIFVQRYHIQAQFFRDNVKRGAGGETRIGFHHIGIKTVTGVGRNLTIGGEVKPTMIPFAKCDDVTMYDLTAFGRSRSAGGVKHDEKRLGLW